MSGMPRPDPVRYRTTNWKSYNEALKRRASPLIWRDRDMAWPAPKFGANGRPAMFNDTAVRFCSMVKVLVRAAVEADDRGWWRAFCRYLALTGRCRIFPA